MSGPPDGLKPITLWMALTTRPRPHRVVPFPREDADGKPCGEVALWVLTIEEILECQAAAEKVTEETLKRFKVEGTSTSTVAYHDIYKNASSVELLCKACREPTDLAVPAFPSPKDVRRWMTSDEISVLASAYAKLQYEIGPIVANMSDAEMEAWLTKLAAGGSRLPLAGLSLGQLEDLVMYSAATHYGPSTRIISAGPPPSAPAKQDASGSESSSSDGSVAPAVTADAPTI